jgi:hypothetical protein
MMDGGQALGWAVVPFSIVLTLGGAWAERARAKSEQISLEDSRKKDCSKRIRIIQKQRAKNNSQQLQAGRDIRFDEKDE